MQTVIDKSEYLELANLIAGAVIKALEDKGLLNNIGNGGIGNTQKPEKSAYAKTETLLYNYNNFVKVVDERMKEIEDIRKHGVQKKSKDITSFGGSVGGTVQGIMLEEESVEAAVRNVEASVQETVQVIALINKCMNTLRFDPYYKILEMRYFEGRTQEDIALEFNCTQSAIAKNKSRLVRELALKLFPDDVARECMK